MRPPNAYNRARAKNCPASETIGCTDINITTDSLCLVQWEWYCCGQLFPGTGHHSVFFFPVAVCQRTEKQLSCTLPESRNATRQDVTQGGFHVVHQSTSTRIRVKNCPAPEAVDCAGIGIATDLSSLVQLGCTASARCSPLPEMSQYFLSCALSADGNATERWYPITCIYYLLCFCLVISIVKSKQEATFSKIKCFCEFLYHDVFRFFF